VLVGRRLVTARPDDTAAEAQSLLDRIVRAGQLPPDVSPAKALAQLRKRLQMAQCSVPPGGAREWKFDLPAVAATATQACMRIRFASAGASGPPRNGAWSIGTHAEPYRHTFEMGGKRDGVHQFALPAGIAHQGGPLVVRYANAPQSDTTIFHPECGVELLIAETSFGANLARALTVVFGYLALLAALGLTAGAMFSFPVAAFTAVALPIVALLTHYFAATGPALPHEAAHDRHAHDAEPQAGLLDTAGTAVGRQVERAIAPVLEVAPLARLSDGVLVSRNHAGRAVLLLLVVYPALIGLAGTLTLARRELALPER
jgi:hypothetical protein